MTSITYRKFAKIAILSLVIFTIANYAMWKLYTQILLTKKYDGGELARMSYTPYSKLYRKNHIDLPRRHSLFNGSTNEKIDLLTLGDSFSSGIGEGRNHFYQDYIASYSNIQVSNIYPYPAEDAVMGFSPLSNLILLYNSGLLDQIKPRYVLIQSIERYCIERFSHKYDFTKTIDQKKLIEFFQKSSYNFDYLPPTAFINEGNYKLPYYSLLYCFSDKAFRNRNFTVVIRKLSKPLFTARNRDKLLFINEDLMSAHLVTDDSVKALNDNLNTMAEMLAKKQIKLYFMPIADKYNLYSDFITDNPYPQSTFFEKLRPLPKSYYFIDTKQILREELERGELDLYYPDDSHWSWKAPKKIFDQVRFQ